MFSTGTAGTQAVSLWTRTLQLPPAQSESETPLTESPRECRLAQSRDGPPCFPQCQGCCRHFHCQPRAERLCRGSTKPGPLAHLCTWPSSASSSRGEGRRQHSSVCQQRRQEAPRQGSAGRGRAPRKPWSAAPVLATGARGSRRHIFEGPARLLSP